MRKLVTRAAALATVVAVLGFAAAAAAHAAPGAKRPRLSGSITVSAAASLTDAFTRIGTDFEKKHERTSVTFNFAASSALAAQIQGGAPADVFASADGANMQKVVNTGEVTGPVDFTANQLTIVVKKRNPLGVERLGDLPGLGVVSLCAAAVPCGRYANQMLQQSGITVPEEMITRGQDVKATLTAVSAGDADAAIVYRTDARAARKTVTEVPIAASLNVLAVYPMAPIVTSKNAELADAWIDYVLSPAGQKTLAKYGFLPVPATT